MCKKLLVFCVMLGLASAAYAIDDAEDVQIGDWESSLDTWTAVGWNNNNNIALWETDPVNNPAPFGYVPTPTSGSYNLKLDSIDPSPDNYWYSTELNYKFIGAEARQTYFGNNQFSIDVATLMADWIPNANAGWIWGTEFCFIMNAGDDAGHSMWTAVTMANWRPDTADYSANLSLNYQSLKDTILGWNRPLMMSTEGWVEFVIMVKFPTFEAPPNGIGDGGIYYLDNAWVYGTPEPTTVALLGLGGLALLRRKR